MGLAVGASFEAVVRAATGNEPYPYQQRLAIEGLPELLKVPTGCGKTDAAVLAWLYRRRFHPDANVRAATPHWLVYVLPMRVLVEQTERTVQSCLSNLGLTDDVGLHVVMGGEGRVESRWRKQPESDAIFIGTLDMLLSRALNRGYGESRFSWPIDFGLFNNGCQWVFDEIQLMGPSLPTSRQLAGLREKLGVASPCESLWMSATVDEAALDTVDNPAPVPDAVVELGQSDRRGLLAQRLGATRRVEQAVVATKRYEREVAELLAEGHVPGSLTIAVLNTVKRARDVAKHVTKGSSAEVVLLHSRFRPGDRATHLARALAPVDPTGPGRIVISTQVIEAGIDVSATTMLTEAAPWPSIVQRAGRCNRDGAVVDATFFWVAPPRPEPYLATDVDAAIDALMALDGHAVTSDDLAGRAVAVAPVVRPVLRRRDVLGLFDTGPDLSGQDLDVGRFIREADDLDVQVAWRQLDGKPGADLAAPTRMELCPVPVGDLRDVLRGPGGRVAWRFDHLEGSWLRCTAMDLRPGQVVLLPARDGGYDPATGWAPESSTPVVPQSGSDASQLDDSCEAVSDDAMTFSPRHWVPLCRHLEDVEAAFADLVESLAVPGLSEAHLLAARSAAALHDVGKAHLEFQETLLQSVDEEERAQFDCGDPWAKSGGRRSVRHRRRYFRHELASALALLGAGAPLLADVEERDLAVYLVAAHHGRIRLSIRSLPGDVEMAGGGGQRVALGIIDGECLPSAVTPRGVVPTGELDLSIMELGDRPDGSPSWAQRVLSLRDRPDLGPFRLAFLEAMVRLADWRASADEEVPAP